MGFRVMDWARVAIDTGGGDFEVGGLECVFRLVRWMWLVVRIVTRIEMEGSLDPCKSFALLRCSAP